MQAPPQEQGGERQAWVPPKQGDSGKATMLAPLCTLTVGQLQEHFQYLKKRLFHLTFQKVSKWSMKAGCPVLPESMDKGSLSGDPAIPDDERLPWKLIGAQADMPNKHIANTGGPPAMAVRLPCWKYGVGSWKPGQMVAPGPSADTTASWAILHFHPKAAGCSEASAPKTCPWEKGDSQGLCQPLGPGPGAAHTEEQLGLRSQVNGNPSLLKEN